VLDIKGMVVNSSGLLDVLMLFNGVVAGCCFESITDTKYDADGRKTITGKPNNVIKENTYLKCLL